MIKMRALLRFSFASAVHGEHRCLLVPYVVSWRMRFSESVRRRDAAITPAPRND
jgi:hypothetical protein